MGHPRRSSAQEERWSLLTSPFIESVSRHLCRQPLTLFQGRRIENDMTRSIGELSKQSQRQTYYGILGVPMGASIDHIKDSYRLLTKKSPATDAAYEILTDPRQRRGYDSELWTERGATQVPAEQEGEFYVTHDDTGWHVIGDNEVGWELESFLPDRRVRLKAPRLLFGPFFSKREAEEVAEE